MKKVRQKLKTKQDQIKRPICKVELLLVRLLRPQRTMVPNQNLNGNTFMKMLSSKNLEKKKKLLPKLLLLLLKLLKIHLPLQERLKKLIHEMVGNA